MSTLKTDKLYSTDRSTGSDENILLNDDGTTNLKGNTTVTGTCTATTFSGSGASLTALPAANLTGALPAISGASLTGVTDTLSNRNLIINGAMTISQRNTSFTGLTSGATYTLDRHQVSLSNAGTWTVTQDTDAPDGFTSSLKLDCTTADTSLGGGDYVHIWHRIENQDLQRFANGTSSAKKWALSFWVKSNKTGTYTMEIYNAIANRGTSKAYTIDSADTWERKTLVMNADTTGSEFGLTNAEGVRIYMYFASGLDVSGGTFRDGAWDANVQANRKHASQVNLADSTSNYLNITGIQLEAADACTEFEHRTYGDELLRCQRYFQVWRDVVGLIMRVHSTTQCVTNMRLQIPMRNDAPTYAIGDSDENFDLLYSGGLLASQNSSGWAFSAGGPRFGGFELMMTRGSGTFSTLDTVIHANIQFEYPSNSLAGIHHYFASADSEL